MGGKSRFCLLDGSSSNNNGPSFIVKHNTCCFKWDSIVVWVVLCLQHFFAFILILWLRTSANRFGEMSSPLWPKYETIWQVFENSWSIWQNFEPAFYAIGQIAIVTKAQIFKNYLAIWSHCSEQNCFLVDSIKIIWFLMDPHWTLFKSFVTCPSKLTENNCSLLWDTNTYCVTWRQAH